ncbi:MAG: hypothetical protein ACJ8FF_07760 [Sphingomicrobium sp.]
MTSFEFVFSLLVILLGLGLGQVLTGLASAVKRRPALKIGWGTGLLAIWVTTETVIFWEILWRLRSDLPFGSPALFGGLAVAALYYFAGALVFPDDLGGRKSLDDYFMRQKAKVIGAILLAVVAAFLLRPLVIGWESWGFLNWFDWMSLAIIYVVGPLAMLTRRHRVAVGCLGVLVAVDLFEPLGPMIAGWEAG